MANLPLQKKRTGSSSIAEIEVLWITAGLGCDGDTIAMTAATQPSIEDVVMGAMPWIPKVNLHNPFLALANEVSGHRSGHQSRSESLPIGLLEFTH
jgi:hydrogenase small subunit